MLDLGFLEDVEKILSLTPNGRQTALFSATMPPPIRKLADRYLYDPVLVKVEADDAHRRHRRAVPRRGRREGQGAELVERARGRAPDAGDRLRAHEDPLRSALPHAARQGHEREGAARRHVAGLARRRDARVQGRARADPRRHRRRRARARHLHRHARRQLRRPDLAGRLRAPHRPHRPRRALRPRDHVRRAAPAARARGDRAAHRHDDQPRGRRARRSRRRRSRSAPSATRSRTSSAPPTSRTRSSSSASAATRASSPPTSSTRSPTRRASTARP